MPVDENTRLRIRQYLLELMDEDAANAMMESMPPIPWTQLATKDDMARLDGRLVGIDRRLDSTNERIDNVADRLDSTNERIDSTNERIDNVADRLDSTNERIDTMSDRIGDLSRTVTVGFFSMALTLAVFMIGTLASLLAAGAFS
ncbi:MAG: hypothetical protein RIB98_14685 [Acidimicrobiales bacterium]